MSDSENDSTKTVQSLKNTVLEVMGTMALADVTCSGIKEMPEFRLSGPVAGLMMLVGERKGMVAVSMPESLVQGIVAGITGVEPSSLSAQDLLDGVGEIINMLSGGMKTKVADPRIQLSPPIAVLGDEYAVEWKTDRPTTVLTFDLAGESFAVQVCTL